MKSLTIAAEILSILHRSYSVNLVIAGGSARDVYHGREPKDYDLHVLNGDASDLPYSDIAEYWAAVLKKIPGVMHVKEHFSYAGDTDAKHIAWVVKFTYKDVPFDLIEHRETMHTPEQQVENFSTTLDMAWFEPDHLGDLEVKTHPEFDDVVSRKNPVEALDTCDGNPDDRLRYLQSKYPTYKYNLLGS